MRLVPAPFVLPPSARLLSGVIVLVIAGIALLIPGKPPTDPQAMTADPGAIARGQYLFEAADCSGCHGSPRNATVLSGGLGLDTPFGTFRVPNITPDRRYGLGAWSEAEFKRALREGVGRRGEYLFPVFPYTSFTRLTDRDSSDLYAYLMSVPPAAVANLPHRARQPFGWRPLLVVWRALFFREGPIAADPRRSSEWNRGNYLVHALAHCEECHTPRNALGGLKTEQSFAGNFAGADGQNAPNITSDPETGIGNWSVEEIQHLLKSGMTPDSDLVGSGMKAVVESTSKLTDADRRAIAVYIKSVAPIRVPPLPARPGH